MSKSMSSALKAHYAQPNTTLATCWLCTLKDGTKLGFTALDTDIVYNGVTYKASSGYTASNVATSDKMNVDNLEASGMLRSPSITDTDLLSGKWDYCKIDIFEVNYKDLTMGSYDIRSGFLGIVQTGRGAFKAELRGLMQSLQQDIGRVYLEVCDADFGDTRCGVNAATYTFSGTVSTVSDGRTFTSTLSQWTGYFSKGKVTFNTGLNAGISMEVRQHTSPGAFALELLMPFPISIGDTFTAVAGCPKTIAACEGRFQNHLRNRSFFLIPGRDRFLSGK